VYYKNNHVITIIDSILCPGFPCHILMNWTKHSTYGKLLLNISCTWPQHIVVAASMAQATSRVCAHLGSKTACKLVGQPTHSGLCSASSELVRYKGFAGTDFPYQTWPVSSNVTRTRTWPEAKKVPNVYLTWGYTHYPYPCFGQSYNALPIAVWICNPLSAYQLKNVVCCDYMHMMQYNFRDVKFNPYGASQLVLNKVS